MKRNVRLCVFLVFVFLVCSLQHAFAQLPDDIRLRSPTRAFNEHHYFAIENGLIHIKERKEGARWRLLGQSGHPEDLLHNPVTQAPMVEISVDGPILIAVSDTQRIYYCINGYDAPDSIKWSDHWGAPLGNGPGISLMKGVRSWALSQDDLDRNKFYYDQNGNAFPCQVTHIYALSANGQEIHFADPWTPPDWGYRIAGPFRDRFISESLSAAASTLFVINRYGDMYTHQNDFDIGGGNPFFQYTYRDDIHYDPNNDILNYVLARKRRIPDQIWYRQPKINGTITKNITIIFPEDGEPGESDRILRVEGFNDNGVAGYYEKNLEGVVWSFVALPNHVIDEQDIIENTPENMTEYTLGQAPEYAFDGTMKNVIFGPVEAKLSQFSLVCSPARLKLKVDEGLWIELKMHHHLQLRTKTREHPGEDGEFVDLAGAIEIPETLANSQDERIRSLLKRYFYAKLDNGKKFVKIRLKAKTDAVWLETISLSMEMDFQ
ncbi:MAG: hypothetical protein MI742_15305 [Desulfobacterales bacterium]|nr:hypothetical protein [Desulfobacterales bacterium]